MIKNSKTLWSIILILITLGLILMIIGFCMGAKLGIYMNKTGIHIMDKTEHSITEVDLGTFTNIDIAVRYSDVEIIESNKYGIDIRYYDDSDEIKWSVENETLKIDYIKNSNINFYNTDLSFLRNGFERNYVKIYLPKDVYLNNVTVKTDSGNITLSGEFSGKTIIDSKYGNVKLNTTKEKDYYSCNIYANYGKITIDDEVLKNRTNYRDNENAENIIKITAESGNITVNFEK